MRFRLLTRLAGLAILTAAIACARAEPRIAADVVSVTAAGEPGAYRFEVGVRSPDTGCEQYADWWEVVSEDGRLIYRRTLAHSHINEQPFLRAGGPVEIAAETEVWVRAHMHPTGYGGVVFKGSTEEGFEVAEPPRAFAVHLAKEAPAPPVCAG